MTAIGQSRLQETNMLKKHMAACLVATAFATSPALAQTPPPPSGPTDRPAATGADAPVMGSPAMRPSPSASADGGQFMTEMQANQMMASKLIGTTVVSANNEAIGDVNDVIVDRNGQAMAVVVGVGGFLGIGEKDVAVPFRLVEFMSRDQMNQALRNGSSNTGVSTTGSTASAGGNASAPSTSANAGGSPDRIVVRMTKAELQAAPAFRNSRNGVETGATGAPASGNSSGPAPGSSPKP
jgi:sporulation protein YlmC with PRC-barrel domain